LLPFLQKEIVLKISNVSLFGMDMIGENAVLERIFAEHVNA
jgi:uncharacterized radical SAM superfamily protein